MTTTIDPETRTLAEALQEPRPNRDGAVAQTNMPNFTSTPGGPNDCPMSFWASWELASRPRRIALLLDDCQEEYRGFAEAAGIVHNLAALCQAFRGKPQAGVTAPIYWSSWSRTYDDGIANAMDRWYGPRGLDPAAPQNAVYVFGGAAGLETLKEISPTEAERAKGCFFLSRHLDLFWNFAEGSSQSYLDEKLKADGVDTVVIAGLWTDECILSTAFAANSRGYDVVVVRDAVATATANGDAALTVLNGTCGKVVTTEQVVTYIEKDFVLGQVGAVKGTKHPDGRKDD